ncbi:hypothetical protein DSECCO2_120120 [anaerobic digester metagenome]
MPDNYVPITGGEVRIFAAGADMNVDTPVAVSSAVSGASGNYICTSIDEGSYFYVAAASGRGRVVGEFTLPNPLSDPNLLTEYIGPINMSPGLPLLTINVVDKDGVAVATGIKILADKLLAVNATLGEYTVANIAAITNRLIEIIPDDDTVYQNLKIYRDITNPMNAIAITLYPPVTLNVTVRISSSTGAIDTTCRLYEMSGATKVREIQRQGNVFPITKLADGTITLKAYAVDGITELSSNIAYNIRYTDTAGTGTLNKNLVYTPSIGGETQLS